MSSYLLLSHWVLVGLQGVLKPRLWNFLLCGVSQDVFGYLRVFNAFILEKGSCLEFFLILWRMLLVLWWAYHWALEPEPMNLGPKFYLKTFRVSPSSPMLFFFFSTCLPFGHSTHQADLRLLGVWTRRPNHNLSLESNPKTDWKIRKELWDPAYYPAWLSISSP